ncbi:MAG: hypothetical protein JW724_01700 [Candidatus Altiarchaeota archaeon]|nr:hypothetical protein [Candidatus Altiarchaeota archaeon]
MIRLTTNVLGAFALKNGGIITKKLFPKDPVEVAKRLAAMEDGVCDEEAGLVRELAGTGVRELYVNNPGRFLGKGFSMEFLPEKRFTDPFEIALELGLSREEVSDLMAGANLELTKSKLRVLERDQIMIQAVNSLSDVEEVNNRLMERLREWYSLHFPELDALVKNQSLYARLVASGNNVSVDGGLLKQITDAREDSMGMDFSQADLAEVKKLAESVLAVESFREETEKYIGQCMKGIAPNTCELAGPLLGARLIAIAGGLERFSKLPASTIQILGAEESFFRFLKTGKLPPKHGVIFQLPEIRSAPRHLRGKISRKFAAKLAIAAKADYFEGGNIGASLRADFLKGVEGLRKRKVRERQTGARVKKKKHPRHSKR